MGLRYFFSVSVFFAVALSGCGSPTDTSGTQAQMRPETTTQAKQSSAATTKPKTVDRGKTLYKKCQTCHTLKEGEKHKVGPNLFAISGAKAGQKEGFNYSKAMIASDVIWTDENLDTYMERPSKFMPGNQMAFVGIRKPEDRKLLIEFLKKETAPQ